MKNSLKDTFIKSKQLIKFKGIAKPINNKRLGMINNHLL